MEDDNLGMSLFLGDEFYDDESTDESTNEDNNNDDSKEKDTVENEPIEDENPGSVDRDETEDENNDNKSDDSDESFLPLYKSLASYLKEEGVLTSVDSTKLESVKNIQDLANLIDEEAKSKELKQ